MLRWAATPLGVRCAMRTLALSHPPAIGLDYALRVLGSTDYPVISIESRGTHNRIGLPAFLEMFSYPSATLGLCPMSAVGTQLALLKCRAMRLHALLLVRGSGQVT